MMLAALLLAAAADAPATNLVEQPAFVRIGAWIPRLSGFVQDGGGELDLETEIDLHSHETTVLGEFELRPVEQLTLRLSAYEFAVSGSGTIATADTFGGMALSIGDAWSADVAMRDLSLEAAWDYWQPYPRGGDAVLTFAPLVSARLIDIDLDLRNDTLGEVVEQDHAWTILQAGLRVDLGWNTADRMGWMQSLSIDSAMLVGAVLGDDGGSAVTVRAGIALECRSGLSLYVGYRLDEIEGEDGDYTWDAGLQGLFLGGQIRF